MDKRLFVIKLNFLKSRKNRKVPSDFSILITGHDYSLHPTFNWLDPQHISALTPKITDCLTHFWPLLPKRKREYIMTEPCIHNVLSLLFRFMKSKLHYHALENQYGRFYSKKYRKFEIFFILFFSKWIKHIDLFQTMDKGGKNSCSL